MSSRFDRFESGHEFIPASFWLKNSSKDNKNHAKSGFN
jgi:hypothetical protein